MGHKTTGWQALASDQEDYRQVMEEVLDHFEARVAAAITGTTLNYEEIAEQFNVSRDFVMGVAAKRGIRRPRGAGSPAHPLHKA